MVLHKQNDVVNRGGVSNQNTNDRAFLRFTNGIFTFYKIINTEKNSDNKLQLITHVTNLHYTRLLEKSYEMRSWCLKLNIRFKTLAFVAFSQILLHVYHQ